jgi:sugar transferase (PEP-CTERM/EpsH1 system associated)
MAVDFVDVDSDKWAQYAAKTLPPMSWIYHLESSRLRRYESDVAHRAHVSIFATPAEESIFQEIAPDVKTAVLPNGVDTEYFRPNNLTRTHVPTVIFTGALDYFPNTDGVCYFSKTIFPLVRSQVPEAHFLIVGRRPSRAVLRLNGQPGITVVGDVQDVRPLMHKSHLAVVPLRVARGIQNKALEAMAMGLPVVASPKPAQGIDARSGIEWFVEGGPEAFAERVVRLLTNPLERAQVGQRARAFVEKHHSWEEILPRLENLLAGVAARQRYQSLAASKVICEST